MRDILLGPVEEVARRLLGATVTSDLDGERVAARIVEVEAYGGEDDPASHAYRGRTARNASMFAQPGTAYVYFTYGMHWCLNVATGPEGQGCAVLVRAGEVTVGVDTARERRTSRLGRGPADRDLARGPARLCTALGVTGVVDGRDLLDPYSPVRLQMPAVQADRYESGPRVGVSSAWERPWRFWLPHEPCVSAYRGARPARRNRRQDA